MAPKGKRKPVATSIEGSVPPQGPSLGESLSYLHVPRPFKNPYYTKNLNRRTKGLKFVLAAEREKVRQEQEKAKEAMEIDDEESRTKKDEDSEMLTCESCIMKPYISIEAPPSVLPEKHCCDITGLEAPYTDPATHLRYHDKSIYDLIKNLNRDAKKAYLVARGVNPVVK